MTEIIQEAPEIKGGREIAYALWGKERADNLQKRIAGAKGRTFAIVHDTMAHDHMMKKIAGRLDAALVRGIDAHWPVVFFEEDDGVRNSSEKLRQHLKEVLPEMEPYIIPTEYGHPVPYPKPPFEGTKDERWKLIRLLFTFLGAKTVRIGGVYLAIDLAGRETTDPLKDAGCVNMVWKELSKSKGLDVAPALADGQVHGKPTTSREATEQLSQFLADEDARRKSR